MATVFGALYVSLLVVRHPPGPRRPGRSRRTRRSAGSAPSAAGSCCSSSSVWSYDTGAYLVGKQFGRHKFLTHISPSKTIEGLVGGVVATTVVVGARCSWALGQSPLPRARPRAAARRSRRRPATSPSRCSSARPAPRTRATLIPGHGGMLDRVDSFLFAAPVVTLYVVAVLR